MSGKSSASARKRFRFLPVFRLLAVVLSVAGPAVRPASAADVSVTVVDLEAKGVDATVAAAASDDLGFYIGKEKIPVVSNDSLRAELNRRGMSQTCGVDDCPVAFDRILKSTHLLRGSVSQLGSRRILKVILERVNPRGPVFSGRREFDTGDATTLAAVKDLAREVVDCLRGKNCDDAPEEAAAVPPSPPVTAANAVPAPAAEIPATPEIMVTIPAGHFLFGDDRKSVYVAAFQIDRTEVTAEAYGNCVRSGNCRAPNTDGFCNYSHGDRMNHPVNCVDWDQADSYCRWEGKRLPTEKEWEKASRGTDGRTFTWGESLPDCDLAVMDLDTNWLSGNEGCGRDTTWPVCSKPKGNSPYDLCDMTGNVWEWTADWFEPNRSRADRGGSWGNMAAGDFQAANRVGLDPASRTYFNGFRCAGDLKGRNSGHGGMPAPALPGFKLHLPLPGLR